VDYASSGVEVSRTDRREVVLLFSFKMGLYKRGGTEMILLQGNDTIVQLEHKGLIKPS
jgi:hypothetical protein